MSWDALSAKAPSLPLSTCMKDLSSFTLLQPSPLIDMNSALGQYQECHSVPLLLLYPVCQSPCHWLEVKVSQQLVRMVVSHHTDTWLTPAEGIYLHRHNQLLRCLGYRPQRPQPDHNLICEPRKRPAAAASGQRATWSKAVSNKGAKVRKEWNSGMASVTCTDEGPSSSVLGAVA